jgi:uncharacterized protein YbbC (DUF1343 family)
MIKYKASLILPFKVLVIFFFSFNVSFAKVIVGAENTSKYLKMIKDKNIGLVVNQSSLVNSQHLIEYLLSKKIKIKRLFALEHGLRGKHDAGEEIRDGIDFKTNIPVASLYGKNKEPKEKDIIDLDIIIFDIQDIGVRFYTFISSMHYILNACAEYNKTCIILDRPNPNSNVVAGPVLENDQKSFLGMYPVPVVYGLTIGELALMSKGEGWVNTSVDLKVIPIKNWQRHMKVKLEVKPSPNLPDDISISHYPSLALFEPTIVSIGRGTLNPFKFIGHPSLTDSGFSFTPLSIDGMSKNPKHRNKLCFGENLSNVKNEVFSIKYFIKYYNLLKNKNFMTYHNFFNKLIGNSNTFDKVKGGVHYKKIEESWTSKIEEYKKIRNKYLIYR